MRHRSLLVLAVLSWPLTVAADQTILDDLVVVGSTCVGQDCSGGESFGFDTLRLKENNLRIRFQDTSTSAAFPSNDWELLANDSANGGQNRFSIEDITGGRTPFTVRAGAGDHALYVAPQGIGLGTSTPVRALHVTAGDTPTLRLEQSVALGWPAQTWEVGGNESTFFVRDETAGVSPFRILPGATDDAVVIAPAGDVGIGTASPLASVHVAADGAVSLRYEDTSTATSWEESYSNGTWSLGQAGSPNAMTVSSGGDITIPGTLTSGSSRKAKRDIARVDPAEILAKLGSLSINRWRYRQDAAGALHIGPMAEDFYAVFGCGADNEHIAPADIAAVAAASAQALKQENEAQAAAISRLEQENAALKRRLERLEVVFDAR
jgi:hypothetical protein